MIRLFKKRTLFAVCFFAMTALFTGSLSFSKKSVEADAENSNPIKVIKVTEENRAEVFATKLSSSSNETYNPADRQWNGIAHIERTASGRLWAVWYSGGNNEPHSDNYLILSYSDDGTTWVDPFIIIDAYDENIRVLDPFLYTRLDGKLTVYFHYNGARWECTVENPEASPNQISWSDPKPTTVDLKSCIQEPVRMKNGELAIVSQPAYKGLDLYYMVSKDDGKTWEKRSQVTSEAEIKTISEAKPVELSDGTIWILARIDCGSGVERYVSHDGGYVWDKPEYDLPYPLIGPGSRFNITKLKSGNLLFVTNDSTSSRTAMTAFLSTDDGKTWPYSLLIDDRSSVTYPEICEDDEGYIYLAYDKGRTYEGEIRLSVFNEADIVAGVIHSEKGVSRLPIAKKGIFKEIVSVDGGYGVYREVKKGTTKTDIIASLPTGFKATLDDGTQIELNGEWSGLGYQSKKEGNYIFRFTPANLDSKVRDSRGLLALNVIVGEMKTLGGNEEEAPPEEEKGCGAVSLEGAAVATAVTGSVLLSKKRKKKLK